MTLDDIRNIDIVSFLSSFGYKPQKESGARVWFLSPLRPSETKPSFYVITTINRWVDHGFDGRTHSIIDLVMEMNGCDEAAAINSLKVKSGIKKFEVPKITPTESPLIIDSISEKYRDSRLLAYLRERKIPKWCYERYTREVQYSFRNNPENKYTGVGFQNDSGGWELRNSFQKYASTPKNVTTFNGGYHKLWIIEGFMDYLSALAYFRTYTLNGTVVVLNGLGLIYRIMDDIHKYTEVNALMDDDDAANRVMDMIRSRSQRFLDHRYLYEGRKDMNDWWKKRDHVIKHL